MINSFVIKAVADKNELQVILDGFFMKSEMELAIHLAKKESEKLKRGFGVKLDLRNFHSAEKRMEPYLSKISKVLKLMGSGSLHNVGLNFAPTLVSANNGGFYPYENEWFF